MDKNQYKISELSKKYKDFSVPTQVVKIKGKSLSSAGIVATNLSVELTVKESSSSCTFDILNAYDLKKRSFNKDWLDKYFVLGNIVDIE
ncbi:hypothetical protein ADUPG1_004796, partial [Aduncisulcus paluster]